MANPELFIAVGGSGTLTTSPDGTTWTSRTSSFSTSAIQSVAWSEELELAVIVGDSGKLATSPDGVTWTSRTSSFGSSAIYDVVWADSLSLFIAVGQGKIATSPDGTTWTQRTSPHGAIWLEGVAWSESLGLAVLVGDDGVLSTSPDGITWTSRTSGFGSTDINSVRWVESASLFVAVGNSGTLTTSPDGTTWTSRTSSFASTGIFDVVDAPDAGVAIAVGASGKFATSPDCITWTQRTSGFGADAGLTADWSPALGLAVAAGSSGDMATSPDGITWTSRTSGFGSTVIYGVHWTGRNQSPTAPTATVPAAAAFTPGDEISRFEWEHNDADDTPPGTDGQSAYEFRYRLTGDVSWATTGKVTSTNEYHDVAASTFTEGTTYDWQVRTYDQADAESPWSTIRTFTVNAAPTAPATLSPDGGAAGLTSGDITFSWVYSDPEADAQTHHQIRYRVVGTPTWTELSETANASPSATIAGSTFTTPNWIEWQVRVRGVDSGWSEWSASAYFAATVTGQYKRGITRYRVRELSGGTFDPATDMTDNSNLI